MFTITSRRANTVTSGQHLNCIPEVTCVTDDFIPTVLSLQLLSSGSLIVCDSSISRNRFRGDAVFKNNSWLALDLIGPDSFVRFGGLGILPPW